MWLILHSAKAEDYVLATGETHSVREFCECAFGYLGLDYRDYVLMGSAVYRAVEQVQLVGNYGKAKKILGWAPKLGFRDMVSMMVDSDLRMLREKISLK